ncbi:MAG: hypothetical protein MI810_13155 [Flavobacteriales bacterium]|nr:hypothetical protein [Flavobacteriales bacterium]
MERLSGLKKRAIRKKIAGINPAKAIQIKPPTSYKKILLISEEEKEGFEKLIKTVFPDAKTHLLHFRKTKEDQSGLHDYSVHATDFNLTGNLKNDKLSGLRKAQFDLILDLSSDSVIMDYFTRSIKAELVVGKKGTHKTAHDLTIEYGHDYISFLENLKHQLELLSKDGIE